MLRTVDLFSGIGRFARYIGIHYFGAQSPTASLKGLRHHVLQVTRATLLGWNLRAEGFAEGDLYSSIGGKFPFADTKAERLTKGDPRLSVEERYAGNDDYVAKLRQVCDAMIADRLLLPRDADCIVAAAEVGENVLTAA